MAIYTPSSVVLRFGTFEVDLRAGEVRKQGVRIKLQDQPLHVLTALLQRPGEVVTREELRSQIWAIDTFVDFDNSLNTSINKLREALGDSADSPRFIETLPRRGYRFVAPVDKNVQAPTAVLSKRQHEKFIKGAAWTAGGVMLLFLLSGVGIWRFSRKAESPLLSGEGVPLVALPGAQNYPAFSPDGNQVAFVMENQNPGIYTTLVGGEKPLQLTNNPGDSSPTWSPDAGQIAFTRFSINPPQLSIFVIPALGGTEHKLSTFPYRPSTSEWLNWSPTGKDLAFADNRRIQRPHPKRDGRTLPMIWDITTRCIWCTISIGFRETVLPPSAVNSTCSCNRKYFQSKFGRV